MADYTWYLTRIKKVQGNWNLQGESRELKVWFGSAPPPNPGGYDLIIIDDESDYNKVGPNELSEALAAGGIANVPPGNVGSAAETTVPGVTEKVHTVGFVLGNGSIQSAQDGYMISLQELDPGPVQVNWQPGKGNFTQFFPGNLSGICFARGSFIETEDGAKPVEDLVVGDLVMTKDHGLQPIRWIGSAWRSAAMLRQNPKLAPIKIAKDTFGPGRPQQDLLVSPQHRVLVEAPAARAAFGSDEILVAARHLCALEGVAPVESGSGVQYFHILLDRHEIIYANGLETESLYLGAQALKTLSPEALDEIEQLFPGLSAEHPPVASARPLTKGKVARALLNLPRHLGEVRLH